MENNKITGNEPAYGLTKREMLAMAAMQAQVSLMANETYLNGIKAISLNKGITPEELISFLSVKQADALIAELNK